MADVVRPVEKRGIVTPIRREKGDLANASNVALVLASVRQILGTRCWDGTDDGPMGELPWAPSFGSLLYKLRHQNLREVLKYQARAYVVDALARWEPRVEVVDVFVVGDKENKRLLIRSTVVIVDADSRGLSNETHTVENTILKAAA